MDNIEDVTRVHRELFEQVKVLFGEPVKVYREYNARRHSWEWTIFARLFGRNARFDVELNHEDIKEKYTVEYLIADIAFQIVAIQERDLIQGFAKPYFEVDRTKRDPKIDSELHPPVD